MKKEKKYMYYICILFCIIILFIILYCFIKVKRVNKYEKIMKDFIFKKTYEYGESIASNNYLINEKRIKKYDNLYKISLSKKDIYLDLKGNAALIYNTENGKKEYEKKEKYISYINMYNPFSEMNFLEKINLRKITGKKYDKKILDIISNLEKTNIYPGLDAESFKKEEFEMYENNNVLILTFKKSMPVYVYIKKQENKLKEKNKKESDFKKLEEKIKKEGKIIYFYRYIKNKNEMEKIVEVPY